MTGVVGGALLAARPSGSLLQVAPSALASLTANSPFPDFHIPGLVLAVVGGGMLGALVIFEAVKYVAIGFMPLQLFEVVVGLIVIGLAARRRLAAAGAHTPVVIRQAAK